MAKKFTMSVPESMYKALEIERKKRRLDDIQDTIRSILSEYFKGLHVEK
jgi:tetrahydromethanopterin S-methyltransferase subunit G